MARIFIDGFEDQDPNFKLWDDISPSPSLSVVAPGTSGLSTYSLYNPSSGDWISKNLTATTTLYISFLYKPISLNNTVLLQLWKIGASDKTFEIAVTSAGTLTVTDSIGTEASSTCLTAGVGKYIEFYGLCSTGGTGAYTVKVNGVEVLAKTNRTTNEANIDSLKFMGSYGYSDNIVLDNSAWCGVSEIQAIVPAADGTTSGWTPSTGTDNYALVDEIPPSTTDYVSTTAVNTHDQYAVTPLTGTIGAIKSVQVQSKLRTLGEPTFDNFAHSLRIGGVDYFGADTAIPGPSFDESDYKTYATIWETSPATAVAFTESEVNAMEIGIKTKA